MYDDFELWQEWEQGSHGRKQLTWSKGMREWARLGAEMTDDEIVSEDEHGEDVFAIHPEDWPRMRDRACELLEVLEDDGVDAAKAWMTANGFRWLPPGRSRE